MAIHGSASRSHAPRQGPPGIVRCQYFQCSYRVSTCGRLAKHWHACAFLPLIHVTFAKGLALDNADATGYSGVARPTRLTFTQEEIDREAAGKSQKGRPDLQTCSSPPDRMGAACSRTSKKAQSADDDVVVLAHAGLSMGSVVLGPWAASSLDGESASALASISGRLSAARISSGLTIRDQSLPIQPGRSRQTSLPARYNHQPC